MQLLPYLSDRRSRARGQGPVPTAQGRLAQDRRRARREARKVILPAITRVTAADRDYPASLKICLGPTAPASIIAIGNLEILSRTKLALMCSVRCPGRIILRAYDLAHSL